MRMCKSLAVEHYTHMTYVCIVTQQNKFIVENFISLLFRFISPSFRLSFTLFLCLFLLWFRVQWFGLFVAWLLCIIFVVFFYLLMFSSSFSWVCPDLSSLYFDSFDMYNSFFHFTHDWNRRRKNKRRKANMTHTCTLCVSAYVTLGSGLRAWSHSFSWCWSCLHPLRFL